jgi:hypothetical protein
MFSGYSQQVQAFDQFFITNRSKLKVEAQRIFFNHPHFEDCLTNNYIKIRQRIAASGFTATKYHTMERSMYSFFWRSLSNESKTLRVKDSRVAVVDVQRESIADLANEALIEDLHNKQLYYDQLDIVVKHLFRFVQLRYNEKNQFLWKLYYLNPDSNTYKKLATSTGYKQGSVVEIIRTIKQDIKRNFVKWLKKELIPEVWMSVKDFPTYEISNKGKLRVVATGLIVKPDYKTIYVLWKKRRRTYKSMEQLMLSHFGSYIEDEQ